MKPYIKLKNGFDSLTTSGKQECFEKVEHDEEIF